MKNLDAKKKEKKAIKKLGESDGGAGGGKRDTT